ncbi:hypothetical protein SAMN05880590_107101 [Rhizobium sp. RU35A]|uniref:Uncharacterized protein n=1 Tax=Rhizobium straminoryzae TaxID=1387186 RepID=A0A549SQ37_9HYPH|nr:MULTISPECIES: hypothetical protein [Rhizobium]TRL31719.1 hypothetical protein FNA46_24235 [Rhizobium straminoryzae]SIQ77198.1 hypothetical protein SAMN05880590_107101 [Rhizobium sp. RU35A]
MTQVLSVSAVTAGYVMEAAKPARRVATADKVKDAQVDAERNEVRKAGADASEVAGLIPAVAVSFDVTTSRQHQPQQQASLQQARNAYEEI